VVSVALTARSITPPGLDAGVYAWKWCFLVAIYRWISASFEANHPTDHSIHLLPLLIGGGGAYANWSVGVKYLKISGLSIGGWKI
jgi:hypothetical protein